MSDLSAFKLLIAGITPGDLESVITVFSYQGFNPELVMKHLLEIKQKDGIGDTDFIKDLTTLLCLGVISGNYTSRNRTKRDEKGTKLADELFSKYKLTMGSIGDNKKAITLPRVLLTFPILTSKVSLVCPEKNYPGPFDSSALPIVMKTSVFPALVPSSANKKLRELLLIVYCCYTCDQSFAINKSVTSMAPSEVFKKQMMYVDIGNKSPEPSQSERSTHFLSVLKTPIASSFDSILKVAEAYKKLVNNDYVIPTKDDLK